MNWKFVVITILLALYLVFDYLYWRDMFELSDQFAEWMQSNSNDLIQSFMILLSVFGEEIGIGVIILWIWLISGNKVQILKVIAVLGFTGYLAAMLRLAYHQPRPYFLDKRLKVNICLFNFGHPSGHAFICTVLYNLLFDTIIFKLYRIDQDNSTLTYINRDNQDLTQKFQKTIDEQDRYKQLYPSAMFTLNQSRIMLYIFIFFIGLSRIYLGVHSLNQIILGFIFGFYFLYLYKLKLEVQTIIQCCINQDFLESGFVLAIYKKFNNRLHYLKSISIVLVIYSGFTMQAIVLYLFRNSDPQIKQDTDQWMLDIQDRCPNNNPFQLNFQDKLLIDTGIVNLPLSIFICLLLSQGSYLPSLYPRYIHYSKQVVRGITLVILLLIPIILAYLLIHETSIKQYFILRYLIKSHIETNVLAVFLVVATPFIYRLLRIDVPGDLMRKHNSQLEGQFATKQELEVEL